MTVFHVTSAAWPHTPPFDPAYAAKLAAEKMRKLQRMHTLLAVTMKPGEKLRPMNTPEAWAPGEPIKTWPPTPVPAVSPVVSTIDLSTYTGSSLSFGSGGSCPDLISPSQAKSDQDAHLSQEVPAECAPITEEPQMAHIPVDSACHPRGGLNQPGECTNDVQVQIN